MVQELYGKALERGGFTVDIAGDGAVALNILRDETKEYDYILVDMLLPHVSGNEFLAQYQKRPGTKIIVLSDFKDPYVISKAFELGARNYWLKSENSPEHLVEKLTDYPGDDQRSIALNQ